MSAPGRTGSVASLSIYDGGFDIVGSGAENGDSDGGRIGSSVGMCSIGSSLLSGSSVKAGASSSCEEADVLDGLGRF